jgi:hypothetical protein
MFTFGNYCMIFVKTQTGKTIALDVDASVVNINTTASSVQPNTGLFDVRSSPFVMIMMTMIMMTMIMMMIMLMMTMIMKGAMIMMPMVTT